MSSSARDVLLRIDARLEKEWYPQAYSEADFFQTFPQRRNGQPMFQAGDMYSQHDRILSLRGIDPGPRPAHPEPLEEPAYVRYERDARPAKPVYDIYPEGYFDAPRVLTPNPRLEPDFRSEEDAKFLEELQEEWRRRPAW